MVLGAAHLLVVVVAQGLLALVPFLPLLAATAGQVLHQLLTARLQLTLAAGAVLAVRQGVLAVLVAAVLAPAILRDRR